MKIHNILITFAFAALFGCQSNQPQTETEETPQEEAMAEAVTLTAADTLKVRELVSQLQQTFERSDIRTASEALYYNNDGHIEPLTDSLKAGLTAAYSMFPVKECRMEYCKIADYTNNSVKLRLIFKSPSPTKTIETAILIVPTYADDDWRLVIGLNNGNVRAF